MRSEDMKKMGNEVEAGTELCKSAKSVYEIHQSVDKRSDLQVQSHHIFVQTTETLHTVSLTD